MKQPGEMTSAEVENLVSYTSPAASLTVYYSDIVSITDTHVVTTTTSYKVRGSAREDILRGKANYELYSMLHASIDVDALLAQKIEDLTTQSLLQYVEPVLDTLRNSVVLVGEAVTGVNTNTNALANAVSSIQEIDTHAISSRTKDIVKSVVKLEGKFTDVVNDLKTLYQ